MQPIIKVENLSKQYRLGTIGTGTMKEDAQRWWHLIRGKEDPYLKIGETNDRSTKGNSDYVWALKDINFEVMPGEVLGIIGKNGAGKSTLLKILSKVTGPTTGSISYNGRIGSLLEVGTGFHPDLTGRENIFLNGAILGMTKREIRSKLDEIIDFSGCERYIDTPVKRYSSGMTVRLGFAVAAHLDPEILIVDEVLAVGDAEFQKKAIGKMQDVSKNEGRTVLFVSHNMTAVEALCGKALILRDGIIEREGSTTEIITDYLKIYSVENRFVKSSDTDRIVGNQNIRIVSASVDNASSANGVREIIDTSNEIDICFTIVNLTKEDAISVGFDLITQKGTVVFGSGGIFECTVNKEIALKCRIPGNFLNDEVYHIHSYFHTSTMVNLYSNTELLTFEIKDTRRISGYLLKINGLIRPQLEWSILA
ncbi:Vitamin B12 import ATP-binding protein BtuD [Dyadobacter sp. CECT 9275]|uniref:Vitamin B12 import ATP-binding protein BtuD n=1 Tax=Dyadobacter helix TaxID=2822344 RepID=A0A916JCB4_9BACT|nr:ABC transporter ATP-binding protein [Dyadobacter sp. CECT 9275]CAG4999741.1 Vitamin B12 import ATP-binding protein BtuD [Dyadobacter sp. CECT 9275]